MAVPHDSFLLGEHPPRHSTSVDCERGLLELTYSPKWQQYPRNASQVLTLICMLLPACPPGPNSYPPMLLNNRKLNTEPTLSCSPLLIRVF